MRCPSCAAKVSGSYCWSCGQVLAPVDPVTTMRRKLRDAINKAPAEVVTKMEAYYQQLS